MVPDGLEVCRVVRRACERAIDVRGVRVRADDDGPDSGRTSRVDTWRIRVAVDGAGHRRGRYIERASGSDGRHAAEDHHRGLNGGIGASEASLTHDRRVRRGGHELVEDPKVGVLRAVAEQVCDLGVPGRNRHEVEVYVVGIRDVVREDDEIAINRSAVRSPGEGRKADRNVRVADGDAGSATDKTYCHVSLSVFSCIFYFFF